MSTYTPLKLDLEDKGFSVCLVPFEIGSRGYVSKRNKESLINIYVANKIDYNVLKLCKEVSKISLLCSFSIFHASQSPSSDLLVGHSVQFVSMVFYFILLSQVSNAANGQCSMIYNPT